MTRPLNFKATDWRTKSRELCEVILSQPMGDGWSFQGPKSPLEEKIHETSTHFCESNDHVCLVVI